MSKRKISDKFWLLLFIGCLEFAYIASLPRYKYPEPTAEEIKARIVSEQKSDEAWRNLEKTLEFVHQDSCTRLRKEKVSKQELERWRCK